ncbi:hypothetical protein HanIR_Chr02g0055671 [Helianthus annuus]|nr:hypothetical protein HanIR_Chr02g0055671 [Helianthus annuus]
MSEHRCWYFAKREKGIGVCLYVFRQAKPIMAKLQPLALRKTITLPPRSAG